MNKVFLGVGHGGKDTGATGYLKESEVNLNMALACKDYLVANSVEVKMSRTKDEDDPLTDVIKECNAYNPDLAVDIHNNAGGGDGCEVYHSIFLGKSKILAENINTELINIGQNSRGLKTRKSSNGNYDYFGFIREIKATSVIVECVFVDNQADASQADTLEEQKTFGVAIAKGILKTLGIDTNNQVQPTKSISDLVNEVIAGKYGVGEERKKALGPLYDEVQSKVNQILLNKTNIYFGNSNYKGSSIVDALNQIGVDSSFEYRKKLATKNGIRNYSGTADQNTILLNKLKSGKLIKL